MKLTDYIIDRLFSVVMFLVAVIFSMGLLWLMGLRYEFITQTSHIDLAYAP